MKGLIVGLTVLTIGVAVSAESFHLKSGKTGRTYGPFRFSDGTKVAIGGTTLEIIRRPGDNPADRKTVKGLYEAESDLRDQVRALQKERNQLRKRLAEEFQRLLPSGRQRYGTFTWDSRHQGAFISITAADDKGKERIAGQIVYRGDLSEQDRKQFNTTCLGMPARRSKDRWVWVLVGRTEIRIFPAGGGLQTDKTLDAIVRSFDLDAIRAL